MRVAFWSISVDRRSLDRYPTNGRCCSPLLIHMRPRPAIAASDAKLRELILFLAQRSCDDERFGSIKLNKLLFFADFSAYLKLGSPITGHAYQRLEKGPAPKKMVPILRQMVDDRDLAISDCTYWGRTQKRPVALRDPKLELFTADEIAVVTDVLTALWKKTARGISSLSHRFSGWKLAAQNEIIPYEVALVHFTKPRKRDIQKALDIGEELAALRKEYSSPNAD
jgi:hypothetical protein